MSTLKWWQDNDRYIQEPFAEIVRYREEVEKMDSENAALKKRILDDNKAYGCELMDPSGTIWDHAKRLQQENAALRAELGWKTKRIKLLSDSLHDIEGVLKKAATSIFLDAFEAERKEAKP